MITAAACSSLRSKPDDPEHERRPQHEVRSERRPEAAGDSSGGTGHRPATRIARQRARLGDQARGEALDLLGRGALLGREHLRGALEGNGGVAEHLEPRVAAGPRPPRSRRSRRDPRRSSRCPRRHQNPPGAGDDGRGDQLARSGARGPLGIALVSGPPGRARMRRPPRPPPRAIPHQRVARLDRPARAGRVPRPSAARRPERRAAPRRSPRRRPRPGRGRESAAGALDSPPDRVGDLAGAQCALERVGRYEEARS